MFNKRERKEKQFATSMTFKCARQTGKVLMTVLLKLLCIVRNELILFVKLQQRRRLWNGIEKKAKNSTCVTYNENR